MMATATRGDGLAERLDDHDGLVEWLDEGDALVALLDENEFECLCAKLADGLAVCEDEGDLAKYDWPPASDDNYN
ncbi:hypothetical protein FGB62_38g15 [Gracilaria domingensis]|nr:hypothetical protein FGB62_38g15 [Gracilaria domingensis]